MSVGKEEIFAIDCLIDSCVKISNKSTMYGLFDTKMNRQKIIYVIDSLKKFTKNKTQHLMLSEDYFYRKFNSFLILECSESTYSGYNIEICWFPETDTLPAYYTIIYTYITISITDYNNLYN